MSGIPTGVRNASMVIVAGGAVATGTALFGRSTEAATPPIAKLAQFTAGAGLMIGGVGLMFAAANRISPAFGTAAAVTGSVLSGAAGVALLSGS